MEISDARGTPAAEANGGARPVGADGLGVPAGTDLAGNLASARTDGIRHVVRARCNGGAPRHHLLGGRAADSALSKDGINDLRLCASLER